jgi:hypothetical protein
MTERARGRAVILEGGCSLKEFKSFDAAIGLAQHGSFGGFGSSTASTVQGAFATLRRILTAPESPKAIHLNADELV